MGGTRFFFTALCTADHVMAVGWRGVGGGGGEKGRVKGGGRERGRY